MVFSYFVFVPTSDFDKTETQTANTQNTKSIDAEKLAGAIGQVESERPSRIGESPSEEEIYNNPYVKHIRTALIGYLDGTNKGIETTENPLFGFFIGALEESISGSAWCGLKHFDKSYYRSKFIIFDRDVGDYELGGLQTYIVFVDNPDTLFWAVTYQYAGGEYVLRRFCGIDPIKYTRHKDEWPERIQELIKESKFSL